MNKQLSNKEKKILFNTPEDSFKITFPNHTRDFLRREKRKLYNTIPVDEQVSKDYEYRTKRKEVEQNKTKINFLLSENERLSKELEASYQIKKGIKPFKIFNTKTQDSEAVAVVLASDWHIEEEVQKAKVNNKNEYTLEIARQRSREFFINTIKLITKEQQDIKINTLILALLGDFISGNIHEELLENCSLRPIDASIEVENMLISGIQYILDNSKLNLIIPCHVGNHARITKKVHISGEQGNSLETSIYKHLESYFQKESRVQFLISDSYYQIVEVFNFKIRFHHGHAIKFGGGIGGIFIPAYKAISQWNKVDHVDLDCFGHLHQTRDGGNFICNGSMIGYSPFAIMIKGDFERPKQSFFLIDKKRGRTGFFPITFSI